MDNKSMTYSGNTNCSATIGDLARLRKKHGSNSPTGHACSNLMEQLQVARTYERPEWAEHPIQTMQHRMQEQAEALAADLSKGG